MPVGGILLAHNFVLGRRVVVDELYNRRGRYARHAGWSIAGLTAWIVGAVVFYGSSAFGGVLPSLVATILVYAVVERYRA